MARKIYETEDVTLEVAYNRAREKSELINKILSDMEGKTISIRTPADESESYRFEESGVNLVGYSEDLIKQAKQLGRETLNTDDEIGKMAVYGSDAVKRTWELFSHQWNFMQEKFWANKSTKEEYERYMVYGKKRAEWQSFVQDFIIPSVNITASLNPVEALLHGGMAGIMFGKHLGSKAVLGGLFSAGSGIWAAATPEDYVPSETQKRWDMEEKYDMYKSLRNELGSMDKDNALSMAGMGETNSIRGMALRLPRSEREFFQSFVNLPEKELSSLREHMPDYMSSMVDYARDVKKKLIAGEDINISFQDTEYGQKYRDFRDNLEVNDENILYLDERTNLNKMRNYESFFAFEDISKLYVYDDDVRQAAISVLEEPIPKIDDSLYYYLIEHYAALRISTNYKGNLSLNKVGW
jgi:hypothetical protein